MRTTLTIDREQKGRNWGQILIDAADTYTKDCTDFLFLSSNDRIAKDIKKDSGGHD
jgi:hypothetical protein